MTGEQLDFDFMASELASELYCDEILDGSGRFLHLDSTVSVSALPEAGRLASTTENLDRREIHNG